MASDAVSFNPSGAGCSMDVTAYDADLVLWADQQPRALASWIAVILLHRLQ